MEPDLDRASRRAFNGSSSKYSRITISATPLGPRIDMRNAEVFNNTLFTRDDQIFQILDAGINAGPGVSTSTEQVTISSINRNFPGRSGPGQVYLASPRTGRASAIEGRIVAYDPESAGRG